MGFPQGEQHCGERPNMGEPGVGERRNTDVAAGPRTKQDIAATRGQRTKSGRRGRVAPLGRRCRARAESPNSPGHWRI